MLTVIRKSFIALFLAISMVLSINAQDTKSADTKVELDGYCPVAYSVMEKSVEGDSKYSSTYEGKTYYLANADAKKMFDAEPEKYLPKYNGYCATAVAMGKLMESDQQLFSVYSGSTYLFSSMMAKESFDKDPKMTIKNAGKNFAALNK
ncbi:MAG: YHS domain-containing (seleno)protein [Ignavibacteriaceae bacterium]